MGYYVAIGRVDRYPAKSGGSNLNTSNTITFRDYMEPQVGRTQYMLGIPGFRYHIMTSTATEQYHKGPRGLQWLWKEGNKPDDHQFTRIGMGRIGKYTTNKGLSFTGRVDPTGTVVEEKEGGAPQSENVGFYQSSTWKELKKSGHLS